MTKFQKIIIALLSAVILAVGIGAAVIINQQQAAANYTSYLVCMEAYGYTPSNVTTDEQLAGAAAAAEKCSG